MQSDKQLGTSFVSTNAWKTNQLAGRETENISRFRLPSLERGKLSFSGQERNHLFQNVGGKEFKDISGISGLDSIQDGRCFALLDFDRDGWQDIALANINTPVFSLFKNQQSELNANSPQQPNMVAVRLVGGNKTAEPSTELSSRDGFGAHVLVTVPDQTYVKQLRCGEGLAAQNSSTMLFGIGKHTSVDSIDVTWPSGKKQTLKNVNAGDVVTVFENQSESSDNTGFETQRYVMNPTSPLATIGKRKILSADQAVAPKLTMYTSVATWCPVCRKEISQLQLLRNQFSEKDLRMVGIPIDPADTDDKFQSYVENHAPPYSLGESSSSGPKSSFELIVKESVGLDILPATVVVDQKGDAVLVLPGVPTVSDLRRLLSDVSPANESNNTSKAE